MKHFMLLCCFFSAAAYSQVSVNMQSGRPNIQLPLWELTDRDLTHSIGLAYNSSGVRLQDESGPYGLGWGLVAGGAVTRNVKGLPDDAPNTGWLNHATNASSMASFANSSDLSTATCADESSDYSFVNGLGYGTDTEPDVFSFTAGGLSGKFIFDNNKSIRLIPYQDVKISFYQNYNGYIISFTITTNQGVVYTFDKSLSSSLSTPLIAGGSTEYLKRNYEIYKNGLGWYNAWKLSKIESPSGAVISFIYRQAGGVYYFQTRGGDWITRASLSSANDTMRFTIRNSGSSSYVVKDSYRNINTFSGFELDSIKTSTSALAIVSVGEMVTKIRILDGRRKPDQLVKEYSFSQRAVSGPGFSSRRFLESVSELSDCEANPPFKFRYYGVNFSTDQTLLPGKYSRSVDFWGYFNGKPNSVRYPTIYVYPALGLADRYRLYPIANYVGASYTLQGADRTPDYDKMPLGSLEQVIYPSGGSATIILEPHDYYDPVANQNFLAGGLRVKQIIYFDGINTGTKMVKDYEYKNGAFSSGVSLVKPQFALPTWEYRDPLNATNEISYATLASGSQQTMWESLTVRSEKDISNLDPFLDSDVVYTKVKEKQTGNGWTVHTFSAPAAYGSVASGDWVPSQTKFARASSCSTMGVISSGGEWGVVPTPQPNYGHERGLLLKTEFFDEQGRKRKMVEHTYQSVAKTGSSPYLVWALCFDKYANSDFNTFLFSKYRYLTDVTKTVSTQVTTTYDLLDASKQISETNEFFYESPNHRLLSRTKSTNSDGTVYTSRTKYPLDFGTIPATGIDKQLEMIRALQMSFRNGTVIESVQYRQSPSQAEKVIGASAILFSDFGKSKILPQQHLSLSVAGGITNFVDAYVLTQGNGKVFKPDTRYEVVKQFTSYDDYELPLVVQGLDRIPTGTLWGYDKTLPVAQVVNATPDQLAFSDFETVTGFQFDKSASIYGAGRTGESGIHPSVLLSKTIYKANVPNYIFSLWVKKNSSPVDLRLTAKNTSGQIIYNQVHNFAPVTGGYEYFERVIPVAAWPTQFVLEVQGTASYGTVISQQTLKPLLDDVAFYPESADITSFTYDAPFGASTVTDTRGVTVYKQYDRLGRVLNVLNTDRHVVQQNNYDFPIMPAKNLVADFTMEGYTWAGDEIKFIARDNCIPGVKYEWDFGNGYETLDRVEYRILLAGNYNIKLRVSHPQYGTSEKVQAFTAVMRLEICASGTVNWNLCGGNTIPPYNTSGHVVCDPLTGSGNNAPALPDDAVRGVITALQGGNGNYTYEWLSGTGTPTTGYQWSAFTYTNVPQQGGFEMQCKVTDSQGRVGYSNIIPVYVYSDPNPCPPPPCPGCPEGGN
ncbi:MAG: hypothetical protein ACKOE6_08500 [Flammeovirgaceae bacterium]